MTRPSISVSLLVTLAASFFAGTASAVVVSATTGNTTAPIDDPGFANVGSCSSASAIYLGNRWVLTAFHVNGSGANSVIFNNTTYTASGPVTRLNNNGAGGMSVDTDMVLFQINADPGLPAIQLAAVPPVLNDEELMIGNGVNREAARTFWQVTPVPGAGNDIWVETAGVHNVEGFKAGAGSAVRWGTNNAEMLNLSLNAGFGDVRSFTSLFDDSLLRPNEAQAIVGDSGGAVFHKNGAQWELSGMMHAIGTVAFDNPPASTVTFNNHFTAMADISFYRNQILAVVPEPSAVLLLLGGLAAALGRRR